MVTIQINNSKHISLRTYINAWKALKAIPKNDRDKVILKESLETWYPVSVNECLRQYTNSVHDRINGRAKGKYLISNFLNN